MPKKKSVKRTSSRSKAVRSTSHSAAADDHALLIIAGGALVIILIVGFFMMGGQSRNYMAKAPVQMTNAAEKNEKVVVISDSAFAPETVIVKAGSTVTWQNSDSVSHSAVADDGSFDTKVLAQGEKGSYTFTVPGTYTYHCGIHPNMTGTIVVEE